jgi:hypothetical protein
MKIVIPGELADLNAYTKANRTHYHSGAKIKQEETDRVAWLVKGKPQFENPVFINFKWYCKNERKDKDNVAFAKKFILDGLVVGGVLKGDGWKHIKGWTDEFFIDKENPRVETDIFTKVI